MIRPAVLGFSGYSGSGKTTLVEKLIRILKSQGLRVSVIKHDAHDFQIDKEGKDSYRFREAGADEVFISSGSKSARISNSPRSLNDTLSECTDSDIVLIEGYKYADIKKIGIALKQRGYELPCPVSDYEAIVTDDPPYFRGEKSIPVFHRDDAESLAAWIAEKYLGENKKMNEEGFTGNTELTHFDSEGNARMVTVSEKDITRRTARAGARVLINQNTFNLIRNSGIKKGDVLTVAQIAGIMGAKRTPDLIPMCHPVIIDGADLRLHLNEKDCAVEIEAEITCSGRTGVEMEAITAVSVAAMTVYDMCKSVQRDIVLTDIRLLEKTGGIHGDYRRTG